MFDISSQEQYGEMRKKLQETTVIFKDEKISMKLIIIALYLKVDNHHEIFRTV